MSMLGETSIGQQLRRLPAQPEAELSAIKLEAELPAVFSPAPMGRILRRSRVREIMQNPRLATKEELADHNARVRRLARDYAPSDRPVVLVLGYAENLDSGWSWMKVSVIAERTARYTDSGEPLSESQVYRIMAKMVKVKSLVVKARHSERTGRQRSSLRKLSHYVAVNRYGYAIPHDWDAPLPEVIEGSHEGVAEQLQVHATPHATPITTFELSPNCPLTTSARAGGASESSNGLLNSGDPGKGFQAAGPSQAAGDDSQSASPPSSSEAASAAPVPGGISPPASSEAVDREERYETALRAAALAIMRLDGGSEEKARLRARVLVKNCRSRIEQAEKLERVAQRYAELAEREAAEQAAVENAAADQRARAECETVPPLVWAISHVACGPDTGKPAFYMPGKPLMEKDLVFSGTEEELLTTYPELVGQRYDL